MKPSDCRRAVNAASAQRPASSEPLRFFLVDVTAVSFVLQPLESAEFRLRVSDSVEPAAMYAKTLKATQVSADASSTLELVLVFCVLHKYSIFVITVRQAYSKGEIGFGRYVTNRIRQPSLQSSAL